MTLQDTGSVSTRNKIFIRKPPLKYEPKCTARIWCVGICSCLLGYFHLQALLGFLGLSYGAVQSKGERQWRRNIYLHGLNYRFHL